MATAKEIIQQLLEIARRSGLHWSKWASNYPECLVEIPVEDRLVDMKATLELDNKSDEFKTLGIMYNLNSDSYSYKIQNLKTEGTTMREFCSNSHSIFDSLNLLIPVIQRLKYIMQQIFREKIG